MKQIGKALVVFLALTLLAGCRTTSRQTKAEQREIWEGRISQQVGDLEDRIVELNADLAALRRERTALDSRISGLASAAERQQAQIDELRGLIKANQEAVDKKIAIILEEVAKENEILLSKIRSSQGGGRMEGYEHVVRSGETLSVIARQYGVTVQAIVEANNLADPNTLRLGQKLFIPQ